MTMPVYAGCVDADVSLEDSGNYTCEINGPLNSLLGSVTHYVFVRGMSY